MTEPRAVVPLLEQVVAGVEATSLSEHQVQLVKEGVRQTAPGDARTARGRAAVSAA